MQSDIQTNHQIVGYSGTGQRPYHPSNLGSTLVPTAGAEIALNSQSLVSDTSHAICWSPGSLTQLTCYNPFNYTQSTPIDKLSDYPKVDGLSNSVCVKAQVDASAAQSKKRKREVADFAESPSSLNYAKRTQIHSTVAEVDGIKLPDGAFKCLMCDKHINVAHSSDRVHRCAACGKRFDTKQSLERHGLRHATSGKAFKCHECPKDYHRKSDLNRHIKEKHTGAPLGCHLCTRRYSRKDHLLKHINTHLNPKRRGKSLMSLS
uniref:C2H2-type domain-containing protein n=1 Tax=Glossina morsitans morsitans TaxID=37546 RepID=A0A1A9YUD7_GLOMM